MIFLYPATWAICTYRFGSWIETKCRLPFVRQILFIFYFLLKRFSEILTNVEISHKSEIGKGFFIGHISGIVIGSAKIGNYSSFHEGVTIGGAGRGSDHGSPIIGDYVYFGAGAKVIGRINIGNNVIVGANAVVVKSVPSNSVVIGIPAKVISSRGSMDFIHHRNKKIEVFK